MIPVLRMNCAEIFFLTIMVLSSGNGKFAGLAEVAPNKCSFHRVQRCLCFEDATAAHVYLLSYCS